MHIAVLDEKIADRKHLERLLDRESDRRIPTTGNLYTDTFGSVDALLVAPKQYDFFMIDVLSGISGCINVAKRVRDLGLNSPICIMRSSAEAEGITDLPDNLLWLEKPIIVAELTATIDKVLELEQKALDDDSSNNITEEGDSSEETEDEINTEATEKQGFFKRLFGI
jgi:DNA-binding response OmpR family regulator